jgi:glycosyltransferase involved in cell wall biosynthesis
LQFHVVQELAPGGIECLAVGLCENSVEPIGLVSLVGRANELISNWSALRPVAERITAFSKHSGFQPCLIWDLVRYFRQSRPSAVVTHHIGPLLYAGIAARIAGVPVVAHIEHDAWHYNNLRRRKIGRLVLRFVRPRLAAVSDTVANGVADGVGYVPTVIPNGADIQRFTPADKHLARLALGLPHNAKIIGCAGRLETVKGFDQLLEAIPQLPEEMHVVIFGNGSQADNLKVQAERLGIQKRVVFAGLSSEMQKVYPAFDLFCLPSRFEGMPLAALEAQACGVPVVGFDVGGVREAVCPETGVLVKAGNTSFLASALLHALEFPVAKSPRDFIVANFSFENTARAYAELTRI